MERRRFLQATVGGGAVALTGCLGRAGFETQSAWRDPPLVENRPDAVYYPAITEGMALYDRATAGPYGIALSYSYPHRFWNTTGTTLEKTVVEAEDSLHLMATIWDRKTGTVVPTDAGLSAEITKDGELVSQEVIYPMLSQQMGFHNGANFTLAGEGSYTVTIQVGGTNIRRTGRFANQFSEPISTEFDIDFRTEAMYDLPLRRLGEKQGTRGAVEPMDMEGLPVGRAPEMRKIPGALLGQATSGDAVFVLTAIPGADRLLGESADRDAIYLAVLPRTPYNRIVLPSMAVRATIERDGTALLDGDLTRTLDPELGYHYGTTIEDLRPGDQVKLSIPIPPQIARHDGYETAFLDMGTIELTVPSLIA